MGCFDTIKFDCPDCGVYYQAQSKSGPCNMAVYDYTAVPYDVARDANRHAAFKCECGAIWRFTGIPTNEQLYQLELERCN